MKIFLVICMLLNSAISYVNQPNSKRLLLSTLRDGDYAHAGDKEAIDLVLETVLSINPNIRNGKVLDVGCGFGGTLEYIKTQGFQHLYGIDMNQDSIDYAKAKYSGINFTQMDAFEADNLDDKFDLIILFNSIYAISDKEKLLQVLNKIANPNAILVIFDYSVKNNKKTLDIKDFAGKPMYPIDLTYLPQNLNETNWNILQINDLSKQYIIWYEQFLDKLHQQRKNLESKFLSTDIKQVENSFAYFLAELKTEKMGGIVIYAKKK
jgi:phosphoethanolamine N-methyltransferase